MKNALRTFAVTTAFAIAVTALPAFAALPSPQEHHDADHNDHPEYRNNKYYRTGNREGYEDYTRKTQRTEHNHKYRNDTDRHAHDYGYQQGWSGTRYNPHNPR